MNRQAKGKELHRRGIQWTDATWNPVGGCKHACRWTMPDGSTAICYAEEIARKFTAGYPNGFEHHYWRPQNLEEPLREKKPLRIFMDSMADLFGHWVPEEQVHEVLAIARRADWHTFQSLTKNAPRLLKFKEALPPNLWAGVSSPPDQMMGQPLSRQQQEKMLHRTLEVLSQLSPQVVTWISFEPLSWDVAPIVAQYPGALRWSVIGAATNGPKVYQCDPAIVRNLLDVLDEQLVPVFFKGNLEGNAAASTWREYFPGYVPSDFLLQLARGEVKVKGHQPAPQAEATSIEQGALF
jgi:protein gp37